MLALSLPLVALLLAIAVTVTYLVTRSLSARQLAEERTVAAADLAAARRDVQWLQQAVEREQASAGAVQATADKTLTNMREAFQSLAAEALHTNRNAFFDLARTAVQPLSDTVKQVHDRLGAVEKERSASFAQLNEQLTALGTTTNTLSRALRTPRSVVDGAKFSCGASSSSRACSTAATSTNSRGFSSESDGSAPISSCGCPLAAHRGRREGAARGVLDAQETTDDDMSDRTDTGHARRVREHMDKLARRLIGNRSTASRLNLW